MQFFYFDKKKWIKAAPWLVAIVLIFASAILISEDRAPEVESVAAMACYEKVVAITFDDGPGYKTTMKLLEGLRQRDVRATFFLVGEKIKERTSVIEQMVNDGHLIGNHTYTHVQLDGINIDAALAEIKKTNDLIEEITGVKVEYIRPPYGIWNESLENVVNLTPILWTVDSSDWNTQDVNQIVEYVVNEVESGDIILMHDIYETSVAAAFEIIDRLEKKGFVFVTVDELMIE